MASRDPRICSLKEQLQAAAEKKDFMNVYLRIRPFTSKELVQNLTTSCIEVVDKQNVAITAAKESATFKTSLHGIGKLKHQFSFSQVFNQEATQDKVFAKTMMNQLEEFLNGKNTLVFAYGVSNAGKTYTVQGTPENPGILPRSIDVLFNTLDDHIVNDVTLKPTDFSKVKRLTVKDQRSELNLRDTFIKSDSDMSSTYDCSVSSKETISFSDSYKSHFEKMLRNIDKRTRETTKFDLDFGNDMFSVWLSFAEIYNENIYDLLSTSGIKRGRRPTLKLAEDARGNVFIKGLNRVCVSTREEALRVCIEGQKNLHFATTKLNQNSSRSHCIFTIELLRKTEHASLLKAKICRLSFCDLAGSERYSKTKNVGVQLKEGCSINTSLLVLGRCISCLRENQHSNNSKIVPFRESKLTRLFQHFFSRDENVSMFVNVNPCSSMSDENIHVLKFSAIAGEIVTNYYHEATKTIKPSRISIMISNNDPTRASIPWFTHEDDVEEFDLDSEVFDNDVLREYVEILKQDLVNVHKEKIRQEFEIRQEMGNSFQQEIMKTWEYFKDKMRKQRDDLEELAANRLDRYINYMENKRQRLVDQEATISQSLYEDLRNTNKEQTNTISELVIEKKLLTDEVQYLKDTLKKLGERNNDLQLQKSTIEMEIAATRPGHIECHEFGASDPLEEKKTIVELQQQLAASEDEKLKMQNLLIEAEVNNQVLQQKLESYEEELGETQLLVQHRDKEIASLELQLEKKQRISNDGSEVVTRLSALKLQGSTTAANKQKKLYTHPSEPINESPDFDSSLSDNEEEEEEEDVHETVTRNLRNKRH